MVNPAEAILRHNPWVTGDKAKGPSTDDASHSNWGVTSICTSSKSVSIQSVKE